MLREKAADLFRYKGIISIKGMDKKYIFQGVHMIFQGAFADSYMKDDLDKDGNVKRISKFVFIGRNLDKDLLTNLVQCCRAEQLRFSID